MFEELDKARVSLTVTILKDGEDPVSREFVLDGAGSAPASRTAYDLADGARNDARTWVNTQRPRRQQVPVGGGPIRYTYTPWQRFLLLFAAQTPTTVTVTRRQTMTEVDEVEIGDGSVHTAAASITVASEAFSDTVSLAGNTSGSPYTLAESLIATVTNDIRNRLFDLRMAAS